MFNCGEGTQRLAHEHKTKLARLEHIFITHTTWNRIGGLPGLCLTVQDSGVPNLTLHGPPGLVGSKTLQKRANRIYIYSMCSIFTGGNIWCNETICNTKRPQGQF